MFSPLSDVLPHEAIAQYEINTIDAIVKLKVYGASEKLFQDCQDRLIHEGVAVETDILNDFQVWVPIKFVVGDAFLDVKPELHELVISIKNNDELVKIIGRRIVITKPMVI